jgi:flagellar motor switch protein FliM
MEASPSGSTALSDFIVERLVGETGEPERVLGAARDLGERAAQAIGIALEEFLPEGLNVALSAVEIARMADAKPTETGRAAMCVAASSASPDALVIAVDSGATAMVASLMFGADAESPVMSDERAFTSIDLEVARVLLNAVATAVNGTGPRSLSIRLPAPPPVTGEAIIKQALRDGPAVRIAFTLHSGPASAQVNVTMPQRLMLKPRGEGGASPDTQDRAGWNTRFGDEVIRSRVRLDATVPLARMTLAEVATLHAGQLIELPAGAAGETRLSSRDKTLFVCEFGRLGQNYTVRISKAFDEREDLMEGIVGG